jgi:hypothetical protein
LSQTGGKHGEIYGDNEMKQILLGSSGGDKYGYGGNGGGALSIHVNGNIIMDEHSIISCNGGNSKNYDCGGGSGGSIKIECNQLFNLGKIGSIGGKGGIWLERDIKVGGDGGMGKIFVNTSLKDNNNNNNNNNGNINPYPCNLNNNNNNNILSFDQIEKNIFNHYNINIQQINNLNNSLIIQTNSIYQLHDITNIEYDNIIIQPYSILTFLFKNKNKTVRIKIKEYLIIQNHGHLNFNGCFQEYEDGPIHGKNLELMVNKQIIIFNHGQISCNGYNDSKSSEKYIGNGGIIKIESPLIDLYDAKITSIGGKYIDDDCKELKEQKGENGKLNLNNNSIIVPFYY